ncbi:hypothetical protein JOD67_006733 [Tenggerimyces flavus]|nr:hypothetical protein [Tenggerimyces flavus]
MWIPNGSGSCDLASCWGPYEYVGRLPWLLRPMAKGGRVFAAGNPGRTIQPVDVRDLAEFALDCIVTSLSGTMNVTAQLEQATYGAMLEECRVRTRGEAELVWVDDAWLERQQVRQWAEIPLWRTATGAWNVRSDRAWEAGLRCRPLDETIADTWTWLGNHELMRHGRRDEIGLAPVKEQALLDAWRQAHQ